jgi:hypothetical protein
VVSIDEALRDRALLGAALGDASSWSAWFAVLRAAFGLSLTAHQQQTFAAVSGGRPVPGERVREFWAVVARRSGKSRIAAGLAVYLACFQQHRVAKGELPMILVLSSTIEQSRIVFNYCLGFLRESPVLCQEIADTTRHEIRLKNGVTIAVHPNSFRSVRGRTLCAAIFDEISFWRDESSATPDREVYSAVLPALVTTNGLLVGISSAYRKTGLIYSKYRDHFGVASDDVLVVKGASKIFNSTLDDQVIAAQKAADPQAALSEWESEFRSDLSGFLDQHVIDGSINPDRPLELPPVSTQYYRAFVDASGGSAGGDAYAIAIAHREDGLYVLDVVRARPGPFDPSAVTAEFASLCRDYRVGTVTGDRYAAEWVSSMWRKQAIVYQTSELSASELYLEALPLFTRALVSLPDHQPLIRELMLLERSTGRMGKDTVSHPARGHDDQANCVCGVLYGLARYLTNQRFWDIMGSSGTAPLEPEQPLRRHPATMTLQEYEKRSAPIARFS